MYLIFQSDRKNELIYVCLLCHLLSFFRILDEFVLVLDEWILIQLLKQSCLGRFVGHFLAVEGHPWLFLHRLVAVNDEYHYFQTCGHILWNQHFCHQVRKDVQLGLQVWKIMERIGVCHFYLQTILDLRSGYCLHYPVDFPFFFNYNLIEIDKIIYLKI